MKADLDWRVSPPMVAAHLHRILREITGDPDPYRNVKDRMNRLALDALPGCREIIADAHDPLHAIIRLAVAGNLLDCGAKTQIAPEDLPQLFATLWDHPLAGDPHELFHAAQQAKRILFLAVSDLDHWLETRLPAAINHTPPDITRSLPEPSRAITRITGK